jgi:hypothetical protein
MGILAERQKLPAVVILPEENQEIMENFNAG